MGWPPLFVRSVSGIVITTVSHSANGHRRADNLNESGSTGGRVWQGEMLGTLASSAPLPWKGAVQVAGLLVRPRCFASPSPGHWTHSVKIQRRTPCCGIRAPKSPSARETGCQILRAGREIVQPVNYDPGRESLGHHMGYTRGSHCDKDTASLGFLCVRRLRHGQRSRGVCGHEDHVVSVE